MVTHEKQTQRCWKAEGKGQGVMGRHYTTNKTNLGFGWGLLPQVGSPSALYGGNNDVELIVELILPSRPLD